VLDGATKLFRPSKVRYSGSWAIILPPVGQPCEEVSERQFGDILAWERLLEEVLRPFLVFGANV